MVVLFSNTLIIASIYGLFSAWLIGWICGYIFAYRSFTKAFKIGVREHLETMSQEELKCFKDMVDMADSYKGGGE